MKTELQQLREQKSKFNEIIEEKDREISELEDKIWSLENPDHFESPDEGVLDISTLDKAMMFEKLEANWHIIKQSDIDAICAL